MRYRLLERRQRLGLTQAELAAQCGFIHPTEISHAEHGHLPGERRLRRIRETLVRLERAELDKALVLQRWNRRQRIAAAALMGSDEGRALVDEMERRLIELWDNCKVEEADILLEFMPADRAVALLDWYFLDDPAVPEASNVVLLKAS